MHKAKSQSGFTLVELLIVIVIIGIIASFVIASYSSFQQKARNTLRVTAVKEYVKLLSSYAAQNGAYPTFSNGACFSTGYAGGSCTNATLTGTYPTTATEQSTFNTQLATIAKVPDYSKLSADGSTGGNEIGAFIYNRGITNETTPRSNRLVYFLEGANQDCVQPRIARSTTGAIAGTGAWTIGAFSNAEYKNSNPGGGSASRTMCMISLLNPDEF